MPNCRALLLGPDPPPPRLGPCETLWVPLHAAIPVSASHARAVAAAGASDYVALTSPRAARALAGDAASHGSLGLLREALASARVAAVGPVTAAEAERLLGARVQAVAEPHTGEALGRLLLRLGAGRVAWLRGDPAGSGLRRILLGAGVELVEVLVYRLVPTGRLGEALEALGSVDYVALTSPSIAEALAPGLRGPGGPRVVAIGPTTASRARGLGVRVDCVASPHTLEGVGACINLLETAGAIGA
ncbi:MAG: uroporphyrinogen-III synthase [Desulfurococcales archaeon]|nr:uroporphyrinogen-III synthase [Desulfurococcales archaeon]